MSESAHISFINIFSDATNCSQINRRDANCFQFNLEVVKITFPMGIHFYGDKKKPMFDIYVY